MVLKPRQFWLKANCSPMIGRDRQAETGCYKPANTEVATNLQTQRLLQTCKHRGCYKPANTEVDGSDTSIESQQFTVGGAYAAPPPYLMLKPVFPKPLGAPFSAAKLKLLTTTIRAPR